MTRSPACPAGADLPGVDPALVPHGHRPRRATGAPRTWHLLDNGVEPTGRHAAVRARQPHLVLPVARGCSPPPRAGWRVVAPDQLGMGWSERLEAPRTLAQRVADLGRPHRRAGRDRPGGHRRPRLGRRDLARVGARAPRPAPRRGAGATPPSTSPPATGAPLLIRLAHLPRAARARPACAPRCSSGRRPRCRVRALPAPVRRALAAPYASADRRRAVGDFVADIPLRPRTTPPGRRSRRSPTGSRSLDVPALLLWGPRDPVFGEQLPRRPPRPAAARPAAPVRGRLAPGDRGRAGSTPTGVAQWLAGRHGRPARAATPSTGPPLPQPSHRATLWSALEDARRATTSAAVVEVGGARVSWAAARGARPRRSPPGWPPPACGPGTGSGCSWSRRPT